MRERWEQTSEWPSTYIPILVCFEPLWNGTMSDDDVAASEVTPRHQLPIFTSPMLLGLLLYNYPWNSTSFMSLERFYNNTSEDSKEAISVDKPRWKMNEFSCLKKAVFTLFSVIVRPWDHQKWIPREILHQIHYLANFPMPFWTALPVIPFSLELLKSWQNLKPWLSTPEVLEIGEKPNPVNIKWSKLYLETIIITF